MELVSIVVPVYNCKKSLTACVDSIRQQTYERLQIILVDDGSTDGSGALCDRIAACDGRVLVLHNPNQGVSATRNCGIRHAKGEYVLFVDSDDFLCPTAVQETAEAACREQAELVLYGFCYHNVTKGTRRDNAPGKTYAGTSQRFAQELAGELMRQEYFNPPWNKLIRTEVLRKNGIAFDERFSILEDMTFSVQVLQHVKRVVLLDRCLYDYNIKESGSLVFRYYDYYFEALTHWYRCAVQCAAAYGSPRGMLEAINELYVRKCYVFLLRTSRQRQLGSRRKRELLGRIAADETARARFGELRGQWAKRFLFRCAGKKRYFVIRLFAGLKGVH